MSRDPYTRFVTYLKVLLPLVALGLLSTMFLLADRIETEQQSIPFADSEIVKRIRRQQVTAPFYSGTTRDGERVTLSAATIERDDGGGHTASDLKGRLTRRAGAFLDVSAETGRMHTEGKSLILNGNVILRNGNDTTMYTDEIQIDLSTQAAIAPREVRMTSELGTLVAGAMEVPPKESPGTSQQLLFSNGVHLVYYPANRGPSE